MENFDKDAFIELPIIMDEFINNYFFRRSGEIIYHYASFDNALSITQNFISTVGGSTLYHSRFDTLSDDYEGQGVEECYLEALNRYFLYHNLDLKILNLLKNIKPDDTYLFYLSETNNTYHAYKSKGTAYICCFSLDKDSEYMWNNYLKGAVSGFALGYDVVNIKSNANDYFGNGYRHIIQKVLYHREDKVKYIYDFLVSLLSRSHTEADIKFYVSNFLNCNKYVFKRPSYAKEKEVRSVIFYPVNGKCNLDLINEGKTIPFEFDFGVTIDNVVYFHSSDDSRERFVLSQTHICNAIIESKYSKK